VFSVLLFGMALMTWFAMGRYFLEPLVIAMFYASFITLAILYRGTEVTAILRSNLLVKLGLYSYGIYMFHQMVAGLIHGYFRGGGPIAHTFYGIFLTVCSTVLTIALAVISYHTYETFFLKKGRRFKYDGSVEKQ